MRQRAIRILFLGSLVEYIEAARNSRDRTRNSLKGFFTVTGEILGTASFMRTDRASGSTEVGSVLFGPRLQRSPIATEAMFLMMCRVFDEQGYRRYEWKCDSLNSPSWRAAERLGFSYEGTFRQVMVYKGRSRDTAWFSMLDSEWAKIRAGFEAWLAPGNVNPDGQQIERLRVRPAA